MVEQNIVAPQFLKKILRAAVEAQLTGHKGRVLEVGARRVAVEVHHARQIDRTVGAKDLRVVELEVHREPVDDLDIRPFFNLQADNVSLAPVVEFGAHAVEQAAGFLLLQIEIAVARDAKGRFRENFIAAIHARRVVLDEIVQKDEVLGARARKQRHETGQSAWNRDHAEHRAGGSLAFAAKQESQAERFVEHPRKRMRGIDRNRSEQRIHFALVIEQGMLPGCLVHLVPLEHADAIFVEGGTQIFGPATVLVAHEPVHVLDDEIERLLRRQAIEARLRVAVFNALQDAGYADFYEFIEIAGRDGQKLHALEQRVRLVLRLFEHPAIETQPRLIAANEKILMGISHIRHIWEKEPTWPKLWSLYVLSILDV